MFSQQGRRRQIFESITSLYINYNETFFGNISSIVFALFSVCTFLSKLGVGYDYVGWGNVFEYHKWGIGRLDNDGNGAKISRETPPCYTLGTLVLFLCIFAFLSISLVAGSAGRIFRYSPSSLCYVNCFKLGTSSPRLFLFPQSSFRSCIAMNFHTWSLHRDKKKSTVTTENVIYIPTFYYLNW